MLENNVFSIALSTLFFFVKNKNSKTASKYIIISLQKRMSTQFYVAAGVLIVFTIILRKRMAKIGAFLASTAHAFATEYNDAYTESASIEDEKKD